MGTRQAIVEHLNLESAAARRERVRGGIALAASLLLILLATLSPGQWTETEGRPQGLGGRIADLFLNVALFAPFGAALGRRGRSASVTLLTGALLSGAIEIVQLGVPGRVAGLGDVLSNAVGAVAGRILWGTRSVWARLDPKVAGRLALAAAFMASGVLGGTGLLLEPSFPPTRYFGHWIPEFGHLGVSRGQVLDATLGDVAISSGPVPQSPELRSRLVAGETLRVRAVAGLPLAALAPLLSINDEHHEVLLLGLDRNDLVYRFRTRAAAWGLDSPELRVPGAIRSVPPEQPLTIVVRPERKGYCIEVNRAATCGIGFSAGTGWALLLYGQGLPPWTHGILNTLWLAGLALPVGYLARGGWEGRLAIMLLASALVLLPAATGLVPTPPWELAAALAGCFGGAALRLRVLERGGAEWACRVARGGA